MAKDRANRTRKNELKIYLSDKEKYILPAKKEMGKRRRITQIECLISERRKRCAQIYRRTDRTGSVGK